MWSFRKPPEGRIRAFLASQAGQPCSYGDVGRSAGEFPAGYDHDRCRIELGRGRAAFEAACAALRGWRMFPRPWTEIYPPGAVIRTGTEVAVLIRCLGLWWLNASRIVYVIDEAGPVRRFAFAYGTLPGHVESGEERFCVEMDGDDRVWYELRAFSRPRYWLVRLGYPVVRLLQGRFRRESQQQMRQAAEVIRASS